MELGDPLPSSMILPPTQGACGSRRLLCSRGKRLTLNQGHGFPLLPCCSVALCLWALRLSISAIRQGYRWSLTGYCVACIGRRFLCADTKSLTAAEYPAIPLNSVQLGVSVRFHRLKPKAPSQRALPQRPAKGRIIRPALLSDLAAIWGSHNLPSGL